MTVGTKGSYDVQEWTAVAQNSIVKSMEYSLKGAHASVLHLQSALDTTTAHTGTRFIVQVSGSVAGDEDWQDFVEFVALIGTAATDAIEDDPLAAGATSITLTGHALTTLGKWLFIKDGVALADSEIVLESAQAVNTITTLDGTTNEHAVGTDIYNAAMEQNITIPKEVSRLRIVVDNSYDQDGSTLVYKSRISKAMGI